MAIDFTRYQPPGIYTEAIGGPQLAVRSSVPTAVAVFGLSVGYKTFRESIKINPDTDASTPAVNRAFTQRGIITSAGSETTPATDTLKVLDPTTGQTFIEGTDYTVVRLTVGEDVAIGTRDDLYTVSRVIDGGHIDPGDTVQVTYNYTDPDYHKVYSLYDYDDVRDFYGEPFDNAGNIQSELTLACKFAFVNGASTVLTCAVDPVNPDVPTMGDYADALDKFRDEPQIAIIVPATGAQAIQALVQQHVQAQSNNRYERRAIVGMDGSVTPVLTTQRVINAESLTEQRVALISPSGFTYYAPELNKPDHPGRAVHGGRRRRSEHLDDRGDAADQKTVLGFAGPAESQREGEKSNESANGLMVVELTRAPAGPGAPRRDHQPHRPPDPGVVDHRPAGRHGLSDPGLPGRRRPDRHADLRHHDPSGEGERRGRPGLAGARRSHSWLPEPQGAADRNPARRHRGSVRVAPGVPAELHRGPLLGRSRNGRHHRYPDHGLVTQKEVTSDG